MPILKKTIYSSTFALCALFSDIALADTIHDYNFDNLTPGATGNITLDSFARVDGAKVVPEADGTGNALESHGMSIHSGFSNIKGFDVAVKDPVLVNGQQAQE